MVDVMYVLVGPAICAGVDLRPVWDAIHEANMQKVPAGDGGKPKKPRGWVPPDIGEILDGQSSLE